MRPRVSVIIPAYNPGDRLQVAIDSVLAQTMGDLECLVIDDGSPQDLSFVDAIADPRVRRIRQANAGVSVARNVGVSAARAELVAFLDQDDVWRPEKLERQLAGVAAFPDASFHHSAFTWVTASGRLASEPRTVTYHGLLSDGHVLLSSVLMRRDTYVRVGGHDPTLRIMQDYDLFLRLLRFVGPAHLEPSDLVDYAVHDSNVSLDYAAAARERASVTDRHAALAQRAGDRETLAAIAAGRRRAKELFGHQGIAAARAAVRSGDAVDAMRHLGRAARLNPQIAAASLAAAAQSRLQRLPSDREQQTD